MDKFDDNHYIKRVINGEPAAFAPIVERYRDMAYNISLRVVRRPEDAEEVTQDAFIKAYRSLKGFKGESRFSTWLYRIVYNTSVSYLRKKGREVLYDSSDRHMLKYAELPEDNEMKDDDLLASALKMALDKLPAAEQTMITLYYFEESSIEEIAGIMDLSVSNVKVKLFRTRKKLYEMINHIMKNEVPLN